MLGVLTGQIGHLRFRSHGFSRGGPAESDDLMSYEKPTRPILKVIILILKLILLFNLDGLTGVDWSFYSFMI